MAQYKKGMAGGCCCSQGIRRQKIIQLKHLTVLDDDDDGVKYIVARLVLRGLSRPLTIKEEWKTV